MRVFTGLFKPKLSITGTDFAGQIEAIGKNVKSFKVGDKVMGFGGVFGCGSHAQYFTLPETKATKAIVPMPDNITYDQAAACLEGAFYAVSVIMQLKPKAGTKSIGVWCNRSNRFILCSIFKILWCLYYGGMQW